MGGGAPVSSQSAAAAGRHSKVRHHTRHAPVQLFGSEFQVEDLLHELVSHRCGRGGATGRPTTGYACSKAAAQRVRADLSRVEYALSFALLPLQHVAWRVCVSQRAETELLASVGRPRWKEGANEEDAVGANPACTVELEYEGHRANERRAKAGL
jgi:hypothetical protein